MKITDHNNGKDITTPELVLGGFKDYYFNLVGKHLKKLLKPSK